MGAIASGGGRILNREVISMSGVDPMTLDAVEEDERSEIDSRTHEFDHA